MSLTFNQLEYILSAISPQLAHAKFLNFQHVGEKRYLLVMEKEKHDFKLLLSLQDQFLRFHLVNEHLRVDENDPFSKKIDAMLHGATLETMQLVNRDRILEIVWKLNGHALILIAEFFAKRPNLYILDENRRILSSLHPVEHKTWDVPSKVVRDNVSEDPLYSNREVELLYQRLEQEAVFQHEKNILLKQLSQLIKRHQKEKGNREISLQKSMRWKEVQQEGELLKAYFHQLHKGMDSITLQDYVTGEPVKIALDSKHTPQESIEHRFRSSKKLKVGVEHAKQFLEKAAKEIEKWTMVIKKAEVATSFNEIEKIRAEYRLITAEKSPQNPKQKTSPFLIYKASGGELIYVAKNAEDNEQLTFKFAHGSDWWLHTAEVPGAHVVIKTKGKEAVPSQESLEDAALLALYYSKAKGKGEAEVHYTQCKFVKPIGRGQMGKVQLSKHKTLRVRADAVKYAAIKARDPNCCNNESYTRGR